jgi:hypothetical protein
MHGRTAFRLAVAACLAGCDATSAPDAAPSPTATAGDFDQATAGAVVGNVFWEGPEPAVPPFRSPTSPQGPAADGERREWPNPHRPRVSAKDHSVAGAVVFLRGVDPARARPWDHPPVRVVIDDWQARVSQDSDGGLVGFVRRGGVVEIESHQAIFHSIRARGAAFFTLAFPAPDQPRRRRLDRPGVVELDSSNGCFWMRAHLFVCEHPYYALSRGGAGFELSQVPPGDYELVCWLPDWREASHELDADTWMTSRLLFRPPLELKQVVRVEPGKTTLTTFRVSLAAFGP